MDHLPYFQRWLVSYIRPHPDKQDRESPDPHQSAIHREHLTEKNPESQAQQKNNKQKKMIANHRMVFA
ncbi:MAG: hypothetical protein AAGF85_04685 [Bacteroidota bacterium]